MHGREPLLWTASTPPHQVTWPLRTVPSSSPRKSLFISFKVSAARTHMCMHTFTLTPPCPFVKRYTRSYMHTHLFVKSSPCAHIRIHTVMHSQAASPVHSWWPLFAIPSGSRSSLCAPGCWEAGLSLSGCLWGCGGGACCSWALSVLSLRGLNSNLA